MASAFEFLKTANDWLEQFPVRMISAFNNFVGSGERIAQEKVDVICVWLSWKANIAIERVRQRIIKSLHEMYKTTAAGQVMRVASAIKDFVRDPLGALGSFASSLFKPITVVFEWIQMLMVELPRLAANLAKVVAALPPAPPSARINYDKFRLKVGSINMDTIMADPSNLPAPEVMFPEPDRPFSKVSFNKAFESSATLKSNQVKYKLSEDDEKSLKSLIEESSFIEFDDFEI